MKYNSIEDLDGNKFSKSRLTPLSWAGEKIHPGGSRTKLVKCLCQCGGEVILSIHSFLRHTISCGCFFKEKRQSVYSRKIRVSYNHMMDRCYNKNSNSYHRYGARGVKVCIEWRENRLLFYEWASKNGCVGKAQLDKDILGDGFLYSPSTCCYVTSMENNNHRRDNKKYLYEGKMLTLARISVICGIKEPTLRKRIKMHGKLDVSSLKKNQYGS